MLRFDQLEKKATRTYYKIGRADEDRSKSITIEPCILNCLCEDEVKKLLIECCHGTEDIVRERTNSSYDCGGSTLSSALVTQNKVYNTILGDSPIAIYVKNKDTWSFLQQSVAHDGQNPDEIIRLGHFLRNGRIMNRIAVTRALGDYQHVCYGLLHTPDIEIIDLSQYDDFVVIVASDGADYIFPKDNPEAKFIEEYLNENMLQQGNLNDDTKNNFAKMIGEQSYPLFLDVVYGKTERVDDIIVEVIFKDDVRENNKLATVCDGHAGKVVANIAIEAFPALVEERLIALVNQQESGKKIALKN